VVVAAAADVVVADVVVAEDVGVKTIR